MFLLPLPRKTWELERPEEQGGRKLTSLKDFLTGKKRQNVFIAIKNPLVIKHPQCITWYFQTVVMLGT